MVRRSCTRHFGLPTLTLWLAVVLQAATPAGSQICGCEDAADHHCKDVPSLSCCCTSRTAVAVAPGARLVTQDSLAPVHMPCAERLFVDDKAAALETRVRLWLAGTPSHASPPLDRPILHAALLL